jgi:hypothetical protein
MAQGQGFWLEDSGNNAPTWETDYSDPWAIKKIGEVKSHPPGGLIRLDP